MDYAASVNSVAMRAGRLSAAGVPIVGAASTKNAFVTNQFTRVSFTPEYEAGQEVRQVNADGVQCVYYKTPDQPKRVNLELAICNPQPEFTELLAGGTLLMGSAGTAKTVSNKALTSNVATITTSTPHLLAIGDTVTIALSSADPVFDGTQVVTGIPTGTTFTFAKVNANVASTASAGTATKVAEAQGWALPVIGSNLLTDGTSLEVWSRAIVGGKPAVNNPYWRWVFPYVQFRYTGDRVLENGLMANTFTGEGLGNANFGDGPNNDWTFPAAATSAMAYARDAAAPTGINDYVAVLA